MGEQEPLRLVEINWSKGLITVQALHVVVGLLLKQKRLDPQRVLTESRKSHEQIFVDLPWFTQANSLDSAYRKIGSSFNKSDLQEKNELLIVPGLVFFDSKIDNARNIGEFIKKEREIIHSIYSIISKQQLYFMSYILMLNVSAFLPLALKVVHGVGAVKNEVIGYIVVVNIVNPRNNRYAPKMTYIGA